MHDLAFSVSATTRPARPGEIHGVDYVFSTPEEFRRMMEQGELLEWTLYCGHYYGTPRRQLESSLGAGRDVLLDIDTRGALFVRKEVPGAVSIFVVPPTFAELERRIRSRGPTSPLELASRLDQARAELAQAPNYDYIVFNDTLPSATSAVLAIIHAERCRTVRLAEALALLPEGGGSR
jgi:guanylate kinase